MKKYILLISIIVAASSFNPPKKILTIAFGSCNKTTEAQPLWKVIMQDNPDLWIWLGDNIYGDSNDTAVLRAKYNAQLAQEDYKELLAKVPVIGTWDDHDYGKNDGNKTYPVRKESLQIALDFLGEKKNSPRRKQEGIYTSYNYKVGRKTIKVILLDVRYNQDPIERDSKGYIPNATADILGETQWKWLEAQLKDSKADAHIIGSGLQFIPNEHRTEMWANFPSSLQRFYKLLADSKAKGVMLITGDRHIGEFTKKDIPGMSYPLYEFTSSGMTHSSVNDTLNKNSLRVGALVTRKNYGLFRFEDKGKTLEVECSLKGEDGVIFTTEKVSY
ncbi:alkaline phosphatase family protein [Chitinophaga sp. SYP-B3965]|uniref:alkaline phosphatase D family protein n=1 Tax=Chitinophaga sp. SYP-B3965 TaxID=2663120 RepID=UPI00129964E2|nr:alkaline phosphatase D family protein [Chitinophaga sp. SYP-B3965]MRG44200.1 alkaline phosphatase family protein [Chitinophaga sp. SYP-B3965]